MVKSKIDCQFFLERQNVTHEKILVSSYSFMNFISVNCFKDCCLNFFNIGCFLMFNYHMLISFNHNCHKKEVTFFAENLLNITGTTLFNLKTQKYYEICLTRIIYRTYEDYKSHLNNK